MISSQAIGLKAVLRSTLNFDSHIATTASEFLELPMATVKMRVKD